MVHDVEVAGLDFIVTPEVIYGTGIVICQIKYMKHKSWSCTFQVIGHHGTTV